MAAAILGLKVPEIILEFSKSLWKIISPLALERAEGLIKDVLKMDTSSASQSVEDDQLYNFALLMGKLSPNERLEIRKFRNQIREEKGKKMEKAFVLYIASFVARFSYKKKTNEINYKTGIEVTTQFLKELLSYQTFEKRISFLQNQDMQVLIKEEEKSLKKRTQEIIETAWPDIEKRFKELLGVENFEELKEKINKALQKTDKVVASVVLKTAEVIDDWDQPLIKAYNKYKAAGPVGKFLRMVFILPFK